MNASVRVVEMRLALLGTTFGLIGVYAVGYAYSLPLGILTDAVTKYCILVFLICYIIAKVS